jgi:Tfp pilus assembly protein PilF
MYRMGRYFADNWNTAKAIQYFEQAIKQDSGFALAHAALASMLLLDADTKGVPSVAYYPRMGTLLRKSIELDPSIAAAHTWMGFYLLNFTHDFPGAEAEHLRAMKLEPNSSDPFVWYGWHLFQVDRLDDAVPIFRRSVELDPASFLALGHLIRALNYTGKLDESMRLVQRGLEMKSDWEPFTHQYAYLLVKRGLPDSAVRVLDREPNPGDNWAPRGWLYAQAGRPDKARAMLRYMLEASRSKPVDPVPLGWLQIALGNEREALDLMERGYAERSNLLLMLLGPHPAFDPLRSNPRFIELRRKVGFPARDTRRGS